jgi:RNA polymerase sigma-70 factor (ECF subfamily)
MRVVNAPHESPAERALIQQLKAADPAAFDVIYERERARVFSFLLRMTGRRELAEDLVQETFLRLVRHAPRLREDTRVGVWLLTVARNLCRSHFRWAFVDRVARAQPMAADGDAAPSPIELIAARELERRLERALASLGVDQREVLILSAIERLATEDIAHMLKLTNEAVRQRVARARKQLGEHLAALEQNGTPQLALEEPDGT